MKKVLKIVAFVVLIALAIVCLGFMIYHSIVMAECLMRLSLYDLSHAMRTALSQNAVSNLKQSLSFAFNTFSCIVFCVLLYKNVSFTDAMNELKVRSKIAKSERNQKKIAKMKSKIEKMESDE